MPKKFIPLIVGVAFALLAGFLAVKYLEKQKEALRKEAHQTVVSLQRDQVSVFVAQKRISSGTLITADLVDTKILFKRDAKPDAVKFYGELEGKAAARTIAAGEQITLDSLRDSDALSGQSLSMVIPQGKRGIQIQVENIASLVKMIRPGDHVDINGIIPIGRQGSQVQVMNIPLFQDVLVLAVGENFSGVTDAKAKRGFNLKRFLGTEEKKQAKTPSNPLITVALAPEEAGIVSFVQEQGKIKLTLRGQLDTGKKPIPPITPQAFMQFLAARGIIPEQPTEQEEVVEEKDTIEIYRGLNKETVEAK